MIALRRGMVVPILVRSEAGEREIQLRGDCLTYDPTTNIHNMAPSYLSYSSMVAPTMKSHFAVFELHIYL